MKKVIMIDYYYNDEENEYGYKDIHISFPLLSNKDSEELEVTKLSPIEDFYDDFFRTRTEKVIEKYYMVFDDTMDFDEALSRIEWLDPIEPIEFCAYHWHMLKKLTGAPKDFRKLYKYLLPKYYSPIHSSYGDYYDKNGCVQNTHYDYERVIRRPHPRRPLAAVEE